MKLRNNIAAFGWGLSAAFLLICTMFTYILIRDGSSNISIYGPDTLEIYPVWFMPMVVAVFWLVGVGFAIYVARKPCTAIEVRHDKSVLVLTRYPLTKSVCNFSARDLSAAQVVESTDSDGDPYFRVAVTGPNGFSICIAEGHDLGRCASVCSEFNVAIGKAVTTLSQR